MRCHVCRQDFVGVVWMFDGVIIGCGVCARSYFRRMFEVI